MPCRAANVGAAEKKDKKVVPDWAFYGAAVNFATDVTVLCGEAKTHLPPVASLTKLAQQYGGAAAVAELKIIRSLHQKSRKNRT